MQINLSKNQLTKVSLDCFAPLARCDFISCACVNIPLHTFKDHMLASTICPEYLLAINGTQRTHRRGLYDVCACLFRQIRRNDLQMHTRFNWPQ